MAALTFTAAAMPAAVGPLAGVVDGANSNGVSSAAWSFTGGSGGADTAANAELLKGVAVGSRLYEFLSTSFATQADLDQTAAALGIIASGSNVAGIRFVTAAPGVPTATVATISVAGGSARIALAASISA
jgi:hypothetical protein